jgi:ribokinase
MIVVVGTPAWRTSEPAGPAGRACEIAISAAAAGSRVEVVGRVGDDPTGDALLIALARASVGHAAVLRDPARPTRSLVEVDPAEPVMASVSEGAEGPALRGPDVALGLRYLSTFDVVVVTDGIGPDVVTAALEAASYAGARPVVLVAQGSDAPDLPANAVALGAPDDDAGSFGMLVGRLCAELDRGATPEAALASALGEAAWSPVAGDAT